MEGCRYGVNLCIKWVTAIKSTHLEIGTSILYEESLLLTALACVWHTHKVYASTLAYYCSIFFIVCWHLPTKNKFRNYSGIKILLIRNGSINMHRRVIVSSVVEFSKCDFFLVGRMSNVIRLLFMSCSVWPLPKRELLNLTEKKDIANFGLLAKSSDGKLRSLDNFEAMRYWEATKSGTKA